MKTNKRFNVVIESEIYSCDVTLPEEQLTKFITKIIPAIKKRMKKINDCVELKNESREVVENLIALKQKLLNSQLDMKTAAFVPQIKTVADSVYSLSKVNKSFKASINLI